MTLWDGGAGHVTKSVAIEAMKSPSKPVNAQPPDVSANQRLPPDAGEALSSG